ncbi:hypothetical protein ACOME3_006426 [Neoechinorhynchus agilis]
MLDALSIIIIIIYCMYFIGALVIVAWTCENLPQILQQNNTGTWLGLQRQAALNETQQDNIEFEVEDEDRGGPPMVCHTCGNRAQIVQYDRHMSLRSYCNNCALVAMDEFLADRS